MSKTPDDQGLESSSHDTGNILCTAPSSSAQPPVMVTGVTGVDDNWERFGARERRHPNFDELQRHGSQQVLPCFGTMLKTEGCFQLPRSGNWMVQFSMVPHRSQRSGARPILYEVEHVSQMQLFVPPVQSFCMMLSVGVSELRTHGLFLQPMFNVRVLNMRVGDYLPDGSYRTWTVDTPWGGILRRVWIPEEDGVPVPPPPPPPPRRGRGRGAKGVGKTTYQ